MARYYGPRYTILGVCLLGLALLVAALCSMRRVGTKCVVLHVNGSHVYMARHPMHPGAGVAHFVVPGVYQPAAGVLVDCMYSPPFEMPVVYRGMLDVMSPLPRVWGYMTFVSMGVLSPGWAVLTLVNTRHPRWIQTLGAAAHAGVALVLLVAGAAAVYGDLVFATTTCTVASASNTTHHLVVARDGCGHSWFAGGAYAPPAPPVGAEVECMVRCAMGEVARVGGFMQLGGGKVTWYRPVLWGVAGMVVGLVGVVELFDCVIPALCQGRSGWQDEEWVDEL